MSLYGSQEQLGSVFHIDDSDSTKVGSYPTTADFTIKMNIIRRNDDIVAYAGGTIGQYVANVNANYTNADKIVKGDKIVWSSQEFVVTNRPKYVRLFDRYKVILNSLK